MTCNSGKRTLVKVLARLSKSTNVRAEILDIATILVRAAVPSPIEITAATPTHWSWRFHVMINKNIAPVQGRIATLVISIKRSRHEKAFDNWSSLGPCECVHFVGGGLLTPSRHTSPVSPSGGAFSLSTS